MKKTALLWVFALLIAMLSGCGVQSNKADIAATTLPVYQFTSILCQGTGLQVTRLVTENVSCLHDYSLNANQVKAVKKADLVVISGAGLEDFMANQLNGKAVIDASENTRLLENDPHIWLSVTNAIQMAKNIYYGLCQAYPEHKDTLQTNMATLMDQLRELDTYAQLQLTDLSCRELVTYHDGFSYLADGYDLTISATMEESTTEVLTELVRAHHLPGIFMEKNGSDTLAKTIAAEAGVNLYILDTTISGDDYFAAMRRNIDTLRDALH